MKKEIVFVGKGGQGLGIIGKILALTAILEGKEVASSPSYGGEVTGGLSQSEVIISDKVIDFPAVMTPDILVAMSQAGYDDWISRVFPKSKIFFDIDMVKTIQPAKATHVPVRATKVAAEVGSQLSANMVMLGAMVAVTRITSFSNLFEVIKEETGKFAEINLAAVREGYKLGKRYLMKIN